MQTSVAVFLSLAVIYFSLLVVPSEFAQKYTGWAAQAVSLSGAVATFMLMRSHKLGYVQGAVVLTGMALVVTLAGLAVAACVKRKKCQQSFPVHTLVFSSGFLSGAAAYVGYLLGVAVGLPVWATIVVSVVFAPVFITTAMPVLVRGVNSMLNKME